VLRVLEGEDTALVSDGGKVTVDLVPMINAALARIGRASPELLGRTVDLPDLTVDQARAALEDALGVTLDDDFGTLTVYDDGKLEAARDGLQTFEEIRLATTAIAVLGIPAALWLSRRRRRTLLQLLAGTVIGFVVVRRVALALESEIVSLTPPDGNQAAVEAVTGVFFDPLLDAVRWIVLGALAIAAVAVATAPYPWAVATRGAIARGARATWQAVVGKAADVAWVQAHGDELQIGVAVALALVLWQADLGWVATLLAVVVAGLAIAVVRRVARDPHDPEVVIDR
jgi:hypothetical protein